MDVNDYLDMKNKLLKKYGWKKEVRDLDGKSRECFRCGNVYMYGDVVIGVYVPGQYRYFVNDLRIKLEDRDYYTLTQMLIGEGGFDSWVRPVVEEYIYGTNPEHLIGLVKEYAPLNYYKESGAGNIEDGWWVEDGNKELVRMYKNGDTRVKKVEFSNGSPTAWMASEHYILIDENLVNAIMENMEKIDLETKLRMFAFYILKYDLLRRL